jgi:RND family efflux transporter MFP subunit
VAQIFVRKGDRVSKGQKILKLDDRLILQQQEQIKNQLSFARDLLKRREDLWKQGIGSEVELLSAKNNVEQLERQLAILQEQWATTNVVAEVNGVIDDLTIRVGEIFQGGPQIRIVNTNALKVVANVPEVYLSKVSRGSKMDIQVPDIGKQYSTTVQFISASIDPSSRSFVTEGRLPADNALKPRQVAMVRILDYYSPAAMTVPVSTVQTDEKGKFVYIALQEGASLVARKKQVATGQLQGDLVEIVAGLAPGDKLITAGFQSLYNGQRISIEP